MHAGAVRRHVRHAEEEVRCLPAGFLPTTRAEMQSLGWDECDVVIVSGDAYVDHPAFGAALIGRLLESTGLRVGVLPQPGWDSPRGFIELGRPRLFVGITSGAMDSMVNHYTSLGRIRSDDAYSEDGKAGARPDRAVTVYANRIRQAMPGVTMVLGGIEASLRRLSHYDFWSGTVRKPLLLDTRADILVYGMGERQVVEIARRLGRGEGLEGIPGTSTWRGKSASAEPLPDLAVELPSHESASSDPSAFMEMTKAIEAEASPWCGRALVHRADSRMVVVEPPALPLSTGELDALYDLPFARQPHPRYEGRIPAWDMIRDSITVVRGCAGGCSFCALGLHQGKAVRSRSRESVLHEVGVLAARRGFRGTVTDLGGPTANMFGLGCTRPDLEKSCRRTSCLHPGICRHFGTDHSRYSELLQAASAVVGVKHVFVGSGIRLDLALEDPAFVRLIATSHTSGHLKVAPEHFSDRVLSLMRKHPARLYAEFERLFRRFSREAGREQYLVPYLMAAFPGCTMEDMDEVSSILAGAGMKPQQVQVFLPVPMTMATAMYLTGMDPDGNPIEVARKPSEKRRQLERLLTPGARRQAPGRSSTVGG
jgi:uncharacterized radical SAM protein YgiQ